MTQGQEENFARHNILTEGFGPRWSGRGPQLEPGSPEASGGLGVLKQHIKIQQEVRR